MNDLGRELINQQLTLACSELDTIEKKLVINWTSSCWKKQKTNNSDE